MGASIVQSAIGSIGAAAIVYIIWMVFSKAGAASEKKKQKQLSEMPADMQDTARAELNMTKHRQNKRLMWLIGVPLFLIFVLPAILTIVGK